MAQNVKILARIVIGFSIVFGILGCNDKKKSGDGNAVVVCSQKTRETCTSDNSSTCTYDSSMSRCRVSSCSTYNGNKSACDGETSCRYSTTGDYCENTYNPSTGAGGLGVSCTLRTSGSRSECESGDGKCRCSTPSSTSTTSCGSCVDYYNSAGGVTIDQCQRYSMDQNGCQTAGCQYYGPGQCMPPGNASGSTQCSYATVTTCSSTIGCCVDQTTQRCVQNNGYGCNGNIGGVPGYGGLGAPGTIPGGYPGGFGYPGYGMYQPNGSGWGPGMILGAGALIGGLGNLGQGVGGMFQGAYQGAQSAFNGMINNGYFNGPTGPGYNPYAPPGYNPYVPPNYYPPSGYPTQPGYYTPPPGSYYPQPGSPPGYPPGSYYPQPGNGGLINGMSGGCAGRPQVQCSGYDPTRPGVACSWDPMYGCR